MLVRVALLSYRSKPHSGGQGIYVRHLSRELVALGHDVEVFSGQPYPELDPGVRLTKVPSLDLYADENPFRTPHPREIRDLTDVIEVATMWSAGFPEPRTFARRVAPLLLERRDDFDVVHDNQTLGSALLDVQDALPFVETIHHPISLDRRVDLAAARGRKKLTTLRWYGFVRMQARVARRLQRILTVSQSSATDIAREFGVDPKRIHVVPLGVDDAFRPPVTPRVPGRIIAMASADTPLKGIATLLEAVAALVRDGREIELVLVTRPKPGGPTEKLIESLGLAARVRVVNGLSDDELGAYVGSAEIACVPSLYEGFSLPTAEAMACGTPLVVSRAGAIPEVVGDPGVCADLVTPGDPRELAAALGALLDDPQRRTAMGAAGRARALERFTWRAVAEATAQEYADAISAHPNAAAQPVVTRPSTVDAVTQPAESPDPDDQEARIAVR